MPGALSFSTCPTLRDTEASPIGDASITKPFTLDAPPPPPAADFPALLERGLGRAVLYLQSHSDRPFRSHIARALFNNLAYDHQCEHERTDYLWDIIHATRQPSYYRDRLLRRLRHPRIDDYRDQVLGLAARFAQAGDDEMRHAFYDAFARNLRHYRYLYGEDALLALDGLEGYRRIAQLLMAHPLPGEDTWKEGAIFDDACATFTEAAVLALSNDDPPLAAYLARTQATRQEWKAGIKNWRVPAPPLPSYEELKHRIELPRGQESRHLRAWAKLMPRDRVERLVQDLSIETGRTRLQRYLRILEHTPDIPDLAPVLALTRHEDRWLARRALRALEEITDPAIRARGEELARDSDAALASIALGLFNANPKEGDCAFIENLLRAAAEQSQDALHFANISTREYFEVNPCAGQNESLVFIYEHVACTLCRAAAVKMLKNADACLDWLRQEARYDASERVRELVA